jgi:hypothetical protein
MSQPHSTHIRRLNGLQSPYHPLQLITWALFPLLLLHFYTFLIPILWKGSYIPLIVIYAVLSLVTAYAAYATCSIDPADDSVCELSTGSLPRIRTGNPTSAENQIYCHLCETRVHSSSKHCTHCRKCIVRFDHHCKWLNTCIGAKNYGYFLLVLTSIGVLTSISLALSISFLIESFADLNGIEARIRHGERRNDYVLTTIGVQTVSVISTALLLPLVLLVYQLAGFHAMLLYRGLTTYDFIVAEQKKQREKARKQANTPARPIQQPPPKPQQPSSSSSSSSAQKMSALSEPVQVKSSSSNAAASSSGNNDLDLGQLEEKLSGSQTQEMRRDDDVDSEVYADDQLDPDFGKGSMSEMTSLVLVIDRTPSQDEQQGI